MNQTNHFFNLGYGWLCKHCSAADSEREQHLDGRRGLFSHADADKKASKPPGFAFAGWTDSSRHALTCPRCGIQETITSA